MTASISLTSSSCSPCTGLLQVCTRRVSRTPTLQPLFSTAMCRRDADGCRSSAHLSPAQRRDAQVASNPGLPSFNRLPHPLFQVACIHTTEDLATFTFPWQVVLSQLLQRYQRKQEVRRTRKCSCQVAPSLESILLPDAVLSHQTKDVCKEIFW